MDIDGWTVREAAAELRPEVKLRTFSIWIRRLTPIGSRSPEGAGRPASVYDKAEVRALHQEILKHQAKGKRNE